MTVFLFISESDPTVRAFTADGTGNNLPAEYAPWRATNSGKAFYLGSANDPITIDIRTDGYSLAI
jgi:hypothetical protein